MTSYYSKKIICTDIPQIPSVSTHKLNSSSIMVSWSPTLFSPFIYQISFSCQLVCGLSAVTHQTAIVNGESTTYTITTAAAGSNCSISVTAIFGINSSSNTITSSTITTSAGTIYIYTYHYYIHYLVFLCVGIHSMCICLLPSSYWCS